MKTFYEDMKTVWGDNWSVTSEIGKLRAVVVHRPGREVDDIKDLEKAYVRDYIDGDKARWEHDRRIQEKRCRCLLCRRDRRGMP